jgi:hypothetical protein
MAEEIGEEGMGSMERGDRATERNHLNAKFSSMSKGLPQVFTKSVVRPRWCEINERV